MSIYSSLQGNSFDVEIAKFQLNDSQTTYQYEYKKSYNNSPVIEITCEDNVEVMISEITNTYFKFEVSFPTNASVNISIGKKD